MIVEVLLREKKEIKSRLQKMISKLDKIEDADWIDNWYKMKYLKFFEDLQNLESDIDKIVKMRGSK